MACLKSIQQKIFVAKAKLVHGSVYDYSKVEYVKSSVPVLIICPEHGEFKKIPAHHLRGGKCPSCANSTRGRYKKLSTDNFIEKAIELHSDLYSYDKVAYVRYGIKVIITCKIHGDFKQTPREHLNKCGCPKCGDVKTRMSKVSSKEDFIKKAIAKHGIKYNYDKIEYYNSQTHVLINCDIHGDFKQTPNHHLLGTGCPSCAEYGFNPNKPAILYYLSINNGQAYKIGVTNNTVESRFGSDMINITILKIWEYAIGKEAYEAEQFYLKEYKKYRYTGDNILKSGNSELFTTDIFNLDT